MSNGDLRRYIQQMLSQLAELADARVEDEHLGAMAFELRMMAERAGETSGLARKAHATLVQ